MARIEMKKDVIAMWIDAEKSPQTEGVFECLRNFQDGSHCVERLRWTGSAWITNDREGHVRRDVVQYWADYVSPDGWQDFRTAPGGQIWQRKVMYYCNPEKNPACSGIDCTYRNRLGKCCSTTVEAYAMRTPGGLPLVREVLVRRKPEQEEERGRWDAAD